MLQVCCNKHSRWDYKYKSDGDRDEIEAACLKKHKTDERKDCDYESNDKPDTAKIRSLVNSPFKLTLKCKLYLTIVVLHKEKPAFLRKLLLQVPNLPKIVDTVCVSRGHSESTDFSMSPDGYQAFHTEFLEICNTFYEVLKGGE